MRTAYLVVPDGSKSRQARARPAGLTARQAGTLELLSDGLTNAQVADKLFLSLRTVEKHAAAVLGKLDVDPSSDAVAIAMERDLIRPRALAAPSPAV